ncbi:non-ribosomal peptide synthetase [Chengkuizengella sediminis]|uniref:non-ribosomal peptide synthetase n=1 Tax=Chengkuizengella sediminis TaxID=1885917 RepID=UPI00138A694B|nr:non-ribosomal peptide synthetase [Chengkuizengella sediminis]NDI36677.1 amino acid adenylation domain-containing protein [Chengkuizengella sediminis]
MNKFESLIDVIENCKNDSQHITFIKKKEEQSLYYSDLYDRSLRMLHGLQSQGIKKGQEIIFQIQENENFILLFWACVLGGMIPVPVTIGTTDEHRKKVLEIYQILDDPKIVTDYDILPSLKETFNQMEVSAPYEEVARNTIEINEISDLKQLGNVEQVKSSDIAFIQFSSGSTGKPKGVMLTHDNLLANMRGIVLNSKTSSQDSTLSWMPLTHDMGLIGYHLSPMYANISQFIMPTTLFVMQPMLWLEKASEHKITSLASPNFGYKHFLKTFKPEKAAHWDLSKIRLIFNGAEPISDQLAFRFLSVLEPYGLQPNAMFPVYGMAEASLAVSFPPVEETLQSISVKRESVRLGNQVEIIDQTSSNEIHFVDLGYAVDGCQIRITNDRHIPLSECVIGNIEIRGKNVTSGYYNNSEATNELITEDGWLVTGDLGFLKHNRLFVTGRKKDIIFINGQNVYPHDIEGIAEKVPGVDAGKIAVCGVFNAEEQQDDIITFVVFRKKTDAFIPLVQELKTFIHLQTGLEIKHVIPVRSIPKTTSGKLQRYKLASQYEDGDYFEIVKEMEQYLVEQKQAVMIEKPMNETEEKLTKLWSEVLGIEQIDRKSHFLEIGGNSLKAASLASEVEKMFEVELPIIEFYQLATIEKQAKYILQANKKSYVPINKIAEQEFYPVSSAQKRLYIQEQFEGIGKSYNMPVAFNVIGKPNKLRVEKILNQLIDRHEVLRTSFQWIDGKIYSKIMPSLSIQLKDLETPEELIEPFNLNEPPLIRAGWVQKENDESILILDMHHIIMDGISINVLMEEFFDLYQHRSLLPISIQYKDFAVRNEHWKTTESYQLQESFWANQLSGVIPQLQLQTDLRREEKRTFDGETVYFNVSKHITEQINETCHKKRITLNAYLLSVYYILLNKYTGQDELVVGSLTAARRHPDIHRMLGMFANFLPVRYQVNDELSSNEMMSEMQELLGNIYEHQEYPYNDMILKLLKDTDRSRNPFFDTMLIFHNQLETNYSLEADNLKLTQYDLHSNTSKLDFKLDIFPEENGSLKCILEYNCNLFKRETMVRFTEHYQNILKSVTNVPEQKIKEINILSEEEKFKITNVFNETSSPYEKNKTVVELFVEQANKTPNNIAVQYKNEKLTYRELNEKSNQLAKTLVSFGVQSDQVIAVMAERSLEMIVGIFAILKAGGAYLPIAPDLPEERIQYMLEDSQVKMILTQQKWINSIGFQGKMIDVGDSQYYTGDVSALHKTSEYNNLAYVIYTSGSTGKPKGVMIEHYSVINRIMWMQKTYSLNEQDIILQKTPISFDVSVWELFWWSFVGAKLVLLDPGGEKDPAHIVEEIDKQNITTMHFVPSMLQIFLDYLNQTNQWERLHALKKVFTSGEVLHSHHVAKFNDFISLKNNAELINLYGPTEATVDVSCFPCTPLEDTKVIPIGKPIDNTQLWIVNNHHQLQPIGIVGELCISGDGLARGYIHKEEQTKEKFVPNPFIDGQLMYKTGDLARWLPDGNIEYLGRLDHQVKIRGYRIELAEIEACLLDHQNIDEAVVLVKEDLQGDSFLVAYIVSQGPFDVAQIRTFLKGSLPDYMVPARFVALKEMPLTSNGKINRIELQNQVKLVELNSDKYVAPTNDIEEKLVGLWQKVLEIKRIGVDDDFFELGGHSFKATMLITQIHEQFNVEIPLSEIFSSPTIREIAKYIEKANFSEHITITKAVKREHYYLSSAQKRLFILHQIEGDNLTYHLPATMEITGKLNEKLVQDTFQKILKRHEVLRTSFKLLDGEAVQFIHPEVTFQLEKLDKTYDNINQMMVDFMKPFDLSSAPLLRVGLVNQGKEKNILLFDMHHIVSDGLSIVNLTKEFVQIYQGLDLSPLKIQYKDYVEWQTEFFTTEKYEKQEKYWNDILSGELPTLQLPTDFIRPPVRSGKGDKYEAKLDSQLLSSIKNLALEHETTIYVVMLAVFNILLAKYTKQEDIIIGSPITGRTHSDLKDLIGMFVNTLAMRNEPKENYTFKQFLQKVNHNALQAFENQDVPFEALVEKLNVKRDLSRNPIFDVMFVLQNMGTPSVKFDDLLGRQLPINHQQSKFDLTLEAIEEEQGMTLNFEFNVDLFHKSKIERLAHHFKQLIYIVTEQSNIKIRDMDFMSKEEKKQILYQFNNTDREYPKHKTIHKLFEEQVERTPNHVALTFKDEKMTYQVLNNRANQLAVQLREKGVTKNEIVSIMVERSPEMIIGILAILKAGGAYLPMSPQFPQERISFMLKDSECKLVLTQKEFKEKISFEGEIIVLNDSKNYINEKNDIKVKDISSSEDLAYIIYTSGSTGKPKGVMIKHHSVVNRITWMQHKYPLQESDVIMQKTPCTFDVSVWELFWWSWTGAQVHLLEPEEEKNPQSMIDAIEKHKITTMHFVPSMLQVFFEYVSGKSIEPKLKSLRQVFTSGEALQLKQVEQFNETLFKTNNTNLINLYGPTEATVDVSYYECTPFNGEQSVPIGKPIDNTKLYVVNESLQLQPIGVSGELCISGEGLATGYLNHEELTADKFVPDPFAVGQWMYKTGDLAKWNEDGQIEYLGRMDHQVKIRGYRIELGEIETQLLDIGDIQQAIVVDRISETSDPYLCAYYVSEQKLSASDIRSFLLSRLPDYMIPAYFMKVDKIPLTSNGKVDRKALPEPMMDRENDLNTVSPTNEIQKKLLHVWSETIGHEKIGIYDNFFEVGGNSLLLIRVHSKLEEHWPQQIKVTDLFSYPTIAKLSEFIQSKSTNKSELPIQFVHLPETYFESTSQQAVRSYSFKLEEEQFQIFKDMSYQLNLELSYILLALYGYLFAQITKNKQIPIQVLTSDESYMALKLDLDQFTNFIDIPPYLKTTIQEKNPTQTYTLDDLKQAQMSHQKYNILPLFIHTRKSSLDTEIVNLFHISLGFMEIGSELMLISEFNGKKISSNKMKEFLQGFKQLSTIIANQYAAQSQVSATKKEEE